MSEEVKLSVDSQLEKIIKDLESVRVKAEEVSRTMKESGDAVGDSVNDQSKKTETFLSKLSGFGRRVADSMRKDFGSLASVGQLAAGLKLGEQFKGSITQTVALGDTIRKLGARFNIAKSEFSSFQSDMIRGLGDIGLSSDAASNALEGLADSPVRGQKALQAYAVAAGQLAGATGQRGREGSISKGISDVITAKGGDANDTSQVQSVVESLNKAFLATGKSPQEILTSMERLFASMPAEMRKSLSTQSLVKLASTSQMAGPNSTKFLEEFLSMSKIQRSALDSQGFKGVFDEKGLNIDQFQKASKGILSRIGNDPRMAAKTLGISDEAADGFIRLAASLDTVKKAQESIDASTVTLSETYRNSMGLGDAFRANINRVKGVLSAPLSGAQGGLTDALSSASESGAGAMAVTAGAGALAAILTGGGLKGMGKGLGIGGLLKSEAIEGVTGEQVQKVYVVNASDMGGGGTSSLMGGIDKKKLLSVGMMLGKAGLVGAAGAAGAGVGSLVNDHVVSRTNMTNDEGFEGNAIEQLFFKLSKLLNTQSFQQHQMAQKVVVEMKDKRLKAEVKGQRGASFK